MVRGREDYIYPSNRTTNQMQKTTKPETQPLIDENTESLDLIIGTGLVSDWELEWVNMGLLTLDDLPPVEKGDRPILHLGLF